MTFWCYTRFFPIQITIQLFTLCNIFVNIPLRYVKFFCNPPTGLRASERCYSSTGRHRADTGPGPGRDRAVTELGCRWPSNVRVTVERPTPARHRADTGPSPSLFCYTFRHRAVSGPTPGRHRPDTGPTRVRSSATVVQTLCHRARTGPGPGRHRAVSVVLMSKKDCHCH